MKTEKRECFAKSDEECGGGENIGDIRVCNNEKGEYFNCPFRAKESLGKLSLEDVIFH